MMQSTPNIRAGAGNISNHSNHLRTERFCVYGHFTQFSIYLYLVAASGTETRTRSKDVGTAGLDYCLLSVQVFHELSIYLHSDAYLAP